MKLLRSFPLLVFLLIFVSIVGYCLAQENLMLMLVAGTLAVVSWFVTEGPRGRTIPSWLSHVLVLGVSLGVILDWYQHPGINEWSGVLGRYALWLTVLKLFEHKSPADYGQLLAFSLLLMVMGCLQSADLLFSLLLLLYTILGLYVLLLFQLHGSYEREKAGRHSTVPRGYRLAPMFKPVIGPRVGSQFRVTALVIGVLGFVVSVVLFLVFPRDQGENTIPGLPSAHRQRTAFLNQVNLGGGSRITTSRRPVMRVQLHDQNGRVLQDAPYLIRAGVMSRYYGGGQWRVGSSDPVLIGMAPDEFTGLGENIDDRESTIIQRYKLDQPMEVLPCLAMPIALLTSSGGVYEYNPVTQLIQKSEQVGRMMAFQIKSIARPDSQISRSLLHDQSLRWDSWRFQDEQVRTLARRLLSSNGIDATRPADLREIWRWNRRAAGLFTRYLGSQEFEYTLDLSDVAIGDGIDPITHFLIETKKGHCEYFASALIALCHTVGIQARLVTGYVAYEFDPAEQEYVISESNAHAWVEVRNGSMSWETFDPTPPATLSALHDIQPSFPDRMQRILSRFETGFGDRFLEFNQRDQQQLSQRLDMGWSDRLSTLWEAIRNWARDVNASFRLGSAGYIWMGIVAFALIIAVIALIKLMRRSLRLRRTLQLQHISGSEYQRMLHQLGFYLDMLYVLAKGGHEKPHWQPPAHYAETLAASNPQVARHVHAITELFYSGRYGRRALQRSETREARSQLEQLAALLHVKI